MVVNASTMVEHLIHDPRVNGLNPTTGREKMKSIIMLNDMEQKEYRHEACSLVSLTVT